LPGATWNWDWDLIDSGQDPDISQCAPCSDALPSFYPHTTPSTSRTRAGQSVCADSSDCTGNPDDAFYVSQIPGAVYLAPELCRDATVYSASEILGCGTIFGAYITPDGV